MPDAGVWGCAANFAVKKEDFTAKDKEIHKIGLDEVLRKLEQNKSWGVVFFVSKNNTLP